MWMPLAAEGEWIAYISLNIMCNSNFNRTSVGSSTVILCLWHWFPSLQWFPFSPVELYWKQMPLYCYWQSPSLALRKKDFTTECWIKWLLWVDEFAVYERWLWVLKENVTLLNWSGPERFWMIPLCVVCVCVHIWVFCLSEWVFWDSKTGETLNCIQLFASPVPLLGPCVCNGWAVLLLRLGFWRKQSCAFTILTKKDLMNHTLFKLNSCTNINGRFLLTNSDSQHQQLLASLLLGVNDKMTALKKRVAFFAFSETPVQCVLWVVNGACC